MFIALSMNEERGTSVVFSEFCPLSFRCFRSLKCDTFRKRKRIFAINSRTRRGRVKEHAWRCRLHIRYARVRARAYTDQRMCNFVIVDVMLTKGA